MPWPTALHRMDFEGKPTEDVGDYTIPPERYIGAELFKARPDVGCVIHAHPPGQVLCGMTGVDIQAIVGSQNWGGSTVARKGIPVYPRSVLIHSADLGKAMLAIMGNKDMVLLKGHGNVVVGRSVEDATVKAIQDREHCPAVLAARAASRQHASRRVGDPLGGCGRPGLWRGWP